MIRLEELSMWAEETQGIKNETLTIRGLSLDNGREFNLLNGKKKKQENEVLRETMLPELLDILKWKYNRTTLSSRQINKNAWYSEEYELKIPT